MNGLVQRERQSLPISPSFAEDAWVFRDTLGVRLRGAYLTFHRRANAHFEPFGVTADQFVVLTSLPIVMLES